MYQIIDIETENTGSNVMRDNKRIISVQIGDNMKQELYYADSKDPQWTLERAKKKIESLLSQDCVFVGFNVIKFDLYFLKHFLGVEIPGSNIFDLMHTPQVRDFNKNGVYGLEKVCLECGIEVTHKQKMNEKAESYKTRQDIIDQADSEVKELVKNRGGTHDWWFSRVFPRIAGGHAIYEAYQEFLQSEKKKDTLFYEYAIGDVISEYQLLEALT